MVELLDEESTNFTHEAEQRLRNDVQRDAAKEREKPFDEGVHDREQAEREEAPIDDRPHESN